MSNVSAIESRLAALESKLEALLHAHSASHDALLGQIKHTHYDLYLHLREAMRLRDLYYRDLMSVLDRAGGWRPKTGVRFEAERPVADDTDDHRIPWGTAQDNTRSQRFVARCEALFGRALTYLDLGCSGGGLALDFILRGHRGFGVEGSDFSKRAQRAEWRLLPDALFTADITRRFRFSETDGRPMACDVVTAWEVMEHIAEQDLAGVFDNVSAHLVQDGVFIGSIALRPDDNPETGAQYHRTVQPQAWWQAYFATQGFEFVHDHPFAFDDFCRGVGNGPIDPDYRTDPGAGFHFVARRTR
jgi:SAM-dependent methyltransferase